MLFLLEGPKKIPSDFCLFHAAASWGLAHPGPVPQLCLPWARTGAQAYHPTPAGAGTSVTVAAGRISAAFLSLENALFKRKVFSVAFLKHGFH